MSPVSARTMPTKPLAGLAVILFVATVIGGWLYVDNMRNELEAKIQTLESRQLQAPPMDLGGRMMEPTAANGWRTVTSADGAYQLDLPAGMKLSEGASVKEIAYVMADPTTDDDSLPYMAIRAMPTSEKSAYENLGGTIVISGGTAYWLYLWENMEWEPFDLVAASFKALK